ncbi:MAG: hypothetical protein IKX67_01065 [Bacteroidales bacterium]|nr:hypothetical protein [Bacteroidales bacterium]
MENESIKGFWHVYSDGKQADIPFYSDEDKIFAINSIAIVALSTGVKVLCLNVNDTHLHVIVMGEYGERFAAELKKRLMRYFKSTGQETKVGKGLFLSCNEITQRKEALTKIIYTFRNCMDFFRLMPWEYRFGSGNVYFTERKIAGQPVRSLTYREKRELFHTNVNLPDNWLTDEYGMLVPGSFMDVKTVEKLFGSPRAFLAFLYVRREDEQLMKQQFHSQYLDNRRIQDWRERGNSLCNSYFGKSLRAVDISSRLKVAAKMLKSRDGFKCESFAKALYLKKEDLDLLL